MEECHLLVKKYGNNKTKVCRSGKKAGDCDDIVYGSLLHRLQDIRLWPGNPQEILRSMQSKNLDELFENIRGIKSSVDADGSTGHINPHHTSCGYDSTIDRILDDAKRRAREGTTILDSHRRHMETQQGKLQPSKLRLSDLQI